MAVLGALKGAGDWSEEFRPGGIRAHATGSFRSLLVVALRRLRALRTM